MTVSATTQYPDWRSDFSVGQPELDEQHIVLLELGRQLLFALESGTQSDLHLQDILRDLVGLAAHHDRTEEAILAANGYPDLAAHQAAHAATQARLDALLRRSQTGELNRGELAKEITTWLDHLFEEIREPVREFLKDPHTEALPG